MTTLATSAHEIGAERLGRPRRWLHGLHWIAIAAALPIGLAVGFEAVGAVIALFVLVVPLEKMFRRHDQRLRRPGLRTDLTYALASPVLDVVSLVVGAAIGLIAFPLWVPMLAFRPAVASIPPVASAVMSVLLLDVLIYWTHRLSHEVGFLWRFHSIHHSSRRMDWISGIRVHPFDGVIIAVPFVMLVAAGFDLEVVGVAAVAQIIVGIFAHANVRWRLRPLHRVVMTPEFHHWHHANEPEALHTNYSVMLTVWDQLFGTYRMPRDVRPQVYGNDEALPDSVVGQLLAPFRQPMRSLYRYPKGWWRQWRRPRP